VEHPQLKELVQVRQEPLREQVQLPHLGHKVLLEPFQLVKVSVRHQQGSQLLPLASAEVQGW
jgi:hypothetical protein